MARREKAVALDDDGVELIKELIVRLAKLLPEDARRELKGKIRARRLVRPLEGVEQRTHDGKKIRAR